MFVFATEVQHQYIMKNLSSKKAVRILVDKIRENGDLKDRNIYLNETEHNFILSYLDDLFGLMMATESEYKNRKNRNTSSSPCLESGRHFFVTRK